MATKLNKKTKEDLLQDLLCDRVNINDLSLMYENQRYAFFTAIEERPNILSKVAVANANNLLVPAIEKDPVNFIYLKKEQYTDETAQIYLAYRLSLNKEGCDNFEGAETVQNKDNGFSLHKSVDDKVVLNYNYMTPNGEEIYYFDNELQIPISIKTNFKISLKIKNAATFIEKFDMHASQLGRNKIENVVGSVLENQFRAIFTSYIDRNKIGYYTLCATISIFENELQNKLKAVFAPYGIEVSNVLISKFAIPNSIQERIEDQAFELRQIKAEMYANHDLAKKSLENYEIKLAIENRYPDAERSLTEYEKDMALKRYMLKNGQISKESIDRTIFMKRKVEQADKIIEKEQDGVMYFPQSKNSFKRGYFGWLIICLILNGLLALYNVEYALLFAAFNVLLFGLIALFGGKKFQNPKPKFKTKVDREKEKAQEKEKEALALAQAEPQQAEPKVEAPQEEAATTKDE